MNAMIWPDGTQMTLSNGDVYGLAYDKECSFRFIRSNGSQVQWEVTTPNYTCTVVTPRHSDSFDLLFDVTHK